MNKLLICIGLMSSIQLFCSDFNSLQEQMLLRQRDRALEKEALMLQIFLRKDQFRDTTLSDLLN